MSLVGTRPILQDELRQYELHHRARIAIKPGITGMWQVSGRSDITDFEEVVRLDTEYMVIIMQPTRAAISAGMISRKKFIIRLAIGIYLMNRQKNLMKVFGRKNSIY